MKLSILSTLALATVAMGSALPKRETTESECVKPYLCCGSLSTPLDSTVDPILKQLGIDAANVVGSIGLDCTFASAIAAVVSVVFRMLTLCSGKPWDKSCPSAPKCCTEANLLVC